MELHSEEVWRSVKERVWHFMRPIMTRPSGELACAGPDRTEMRMTLGSG